MEQPHPRFAHLCGMRSLIALLGLLTAPVLAAPPAEIVARETGIGTIYVTTGGYSLYTTDRDVNREESTCLEACAQDWPPFLASPGARPAEDWTLIARPDGRKQWSRHGKPVYLSARDTTAGMTLGEGVDDIWHIAIDLAPRPRAVVFQGTVIGRIAASASGLTLYAADRDCIEKCLNVWKPLKAAVAANALGDWSAVVRSDGGGKQWAYRGKPVYGFANDLAPGDMKGDGMDGAWHAIVLQSGPGLPAGVAVRGAGPGALLVDARGLTLYGAGKDFEEVKRRFCDASCIKSNWAPLAADRDAAARGNWVPVDAADGRQWSYRRERPQANGFPPASASTDFTRCSRRRSSRNPSRPFASVAA